MPLHTYFDPSAFMDLDIVGAKSCGLYWALNLTDALRIGP
jgi:hypothetical protein